MAYKEKCIYKINTNFDQKKKKKKNSTKMFFGIVIFLL